MIVSLLSSVGNHGIARVYSLQTLRRFPLHEPRQQSAETPSSPCCKDRDPPRPLPTSLSGRSTRAACEATRAGCEAYRLPKTDDLHRRIDRWETNFLRDSPPPELQTAKTAAAMKRYEITTTDGQEIRVDCDELREALLEGTLVATRDGEIIHQFPRGSILCWSEIPGKKSRRAELSESTESDWAQEA